MREFRSHGSVRGRRATGVPPTSSLIEHHPRVLHDEDLAHAIVDHVLERGRLLTLDGPSHRTKHLGLDDPTVSPQLRKWQNFRKTRARISGTHNCLLDAMMIRQTVPATAMVLSSIVLVVISTAILIRVPRDKLL